MKVCIVIVVIRKEEEEETVCSNPWKSCQRSDSNKGARTIHNDSIKRARAIHDITIRSYVIIQTTGKQKRYTKEVESNKVPRQMKGRRREREKKQKKNNHCLACAKTNETCSVGMTL
jgi:hypothetical protein